MNRITKIAIAVGLVVITFFIILFLRYPGFPIITDHSNVTKIYYADNISIAHRTLINKFNFEQEGKIEIIPVDLPFSKFTTNERKELLARSLRSNSRNLDLFAVDYIWVPRFAKWVEPLDKHISKIVRDGIIKKALESCVFENKLVAIPLYIDVGLMYYRNDILMSHENYVQIKQQLENSLSWKDFINLCQTFKQKDNYYYLFAADNYEGLVCSFVELVVNQKSDFFFTDSLNFDTKEGEKALKLLVDLVNRFKITPKEVTGFDEFQCFTYALENDVPFIRGWPGQLKHYKNLVKDTTKLKYFNVAALPHLEGKNIGSVLGGWNLMIPANSAKKSETMQFINFLLKEENQKILAKVGGYIPVVESVYNDKNFISQNQEYLYYQNLLERGIHRPFLKDYTKISDIISYYVNQAIKKKISVKEALIQATNQVNSKRVLIK